MTTNVCRADRVGNANSQIFATAPCANLCSAGTTSAVGSSDPWIWTCDGSGKGSTASCSANNTNDGPFSIFHMNVVHAHVTPHKWVINQHGSDSAMFEDVGGDDPFLANNRNLSDILAAKEIPHRLHVWEGRAHRGCYWRKMVPLYV